MEKHLLPTIKFLLAFSLASFISLYSYSPPPDIDELLWEQLSPYFLPENHPIKQKLDSLFSQSRAIATQESLIAAGFRYTPTQGLHVTTIVHPDMQGWILKIKTDYGENVQEWQMWVCRINGSKLIQDYIKKNKLNKIFRVPRKYIYPLPIDPSPPNETGFYRKNFILLAENMDLVSPEKNYSLWLNKITKKQLKLIYTIVTDLGLWDSCRHNNICWCTNGKLAFTDTEFYHLWPVNYHPLMEGLNAKNRQFWKSLYKKDNHKE